MSGPRYSTPASVSRRFGASNTSGVTEIATCWMPPSPSGTGSSPRPGKSKNAEHVAVADVEEEVRRARVVAVLEQLDEREADELLVEADRRLGIGADQREVVHAAAGRRRALALGQEVAVAQARLRAARRELGSWSSVAMRSMIARGCTDHEGRRLPPQRLRADGRAHRRAVAGRAGPRRATTPGLDSLFIGDHHNVPVPYYQNVPMLGRLLAEWDDRPARRAVPAAALASGAASPSRSARSRRSRRARSSCSARSAAAPSSSTRSACRSSTRPSRFEAALDIIRRLCAGEEVSTDDAVRDRAGAHRAGPARTARSVDRRGRAARPSTAPPGSATRSSSGPKRRRAEVSELVGDVPRGVRAPRPHAGDDRGAPRRARRRRRRRRAARSPGPIVDRGLPGLRPRGAGGRRRRTRRRRVRRPRRAGLHRRDHPPSRRRPATRCSRRSSGWATVRTAVAYGVALG